MDVHGFPVRVVESGVDWGDVSGWAQAVGAMIAIWFAGRFSHRDRLKADADRMAALEGLAGTATILIRRGFLAYNEAAVGNYLPVAAIPIENFDRADTLLASIPVMDLGSNKAPDAIINLRHALRQMEIKVKDLADRQTAPDGAQFNAAQKVSAEADAIFNAIHEWTSDRKRRARYWWWL